MPLLNGSMFIVNGMSEPYIFLNKFIIILFDVVVENNNIVPVAREVFECLYETVIIELVEVVYCVADVSAIVASDDSPVGLLVHLFAYRKV